MKLADRVVVQRSLCYDFLTCLTRLQNSRELTPSDDPNQAITSWVSAQLPKLTPAVEEQLAVFFNLETSFGATLSGVIKHSESKTVPEYLAYLRDQVSEQEILMRFLHAGAGPGRQLSFADLQTLIADERERMRFLSDELSFSPREKWQMLQFLLNPAETKQRLIELLDWCYQHLYREMEQFLESFLGKYTDDLNDRIKRYGDDYLRLLLPYNYDLDGNAEEVTVALSYFYERSSFMANLIEDIFVFGYRYHESIESEHAVLAATQLFKTLADETRLNIISLLAQRPWYGHELAQQLGISNSTVSHHVGNLAQHGLIDWRRENNRVYFQLDGERMKQQLKETLDGLLSR